MDNTAAIATPILQRPSSASNSASPILPVTTPPRATSTNLPVFATPPAQATVQTTSTTDVSVNTETKDSPVAKAILEMA